MFSLGLSLIYLIVFSSTQAHNLDRARRCKAGPTSPNWPSDAEWRALNHSLSGNLISPVPLGAVCHPTRPEFNNQSCTLLQTQWVNSSFIASDPAAVDYNDDTCLPSPLTTCSASGYPAYVIAARNAADIQKGVKFASRTGVRLIIKGTGHDGPGRSSGRGSLSIWTHNIRGVEVNMTSGDPTTAATVKIAAGMRNFEILAAAAEKNITVVTGADPNVGIGGWITGGGHGPLSSLYGLGADQVISMEVVTADGCLLQIDKDHHKDLFWAIRGGGGSTFAILISVTVRAYPSIPFTQYLFSYNTTSDSETFWDLTTLFHTHLPRISEAGAASYYYARPLVPNEPNPAKRGQLQGVFVLPKKSSAEAIAIMQPLEAAINASGFADKVYISSLPISFPSFSPVWAANPPQDVGISLRFGSRLLDNAALTSSIPTIKAALRTSTPAPWTLLGHLVAGPGPRNVQIPGGGNAVLPAWRKAYTHIVLSRTWGYLNRTQELAVTERLRNVETQALRDLAPDTGAYMNEAGPTEPEWQKTFWGANYPRLARLKRKWDPRGVFWCRACVGSEEWVVEGGDAIGQHEGRICRRGRAV